MVTLVRRCFAKVRYLNWDDSKDRSKEIFGAGLFKVSENSIKIRFSNELGSAWQHFQQLFLSWPSKVKSRLRLLSQKGLRLLGSQVNWYWIRIPTFMFTTSTFMKKLKMAWQTLIQTMVLNWLINCKVSLTWQLAIIMKMNCGTGKVPTMPLPEQTDSNDNSETVTPKAQEKIS